MSVQIGYPLIKVIGVGGAGSNAIDRMLHVGIPGVEFLAANTDAQALALSEAPRKIQLGPQTSRGLGAGGNPDVGQRAARESRDEVLEAVRGAEILFVALGLGGGTGSGAAPVIAELGREAGALTIAVATIPFSFEGHRRSQIATEGLENLQAKSDTTIAISNDRLLEFIDADTSLDVSFRIADEVLRQGVQGVAELVTSAGVINLNLMHVRTILSDAGSALMSIGQGRGEGRAMEAAELAISSPLTQSSSIEGASAILVNITGGNDLSLDEIKRAVSTVAGAAGPDADVFFGATVDPNMAGQLQVMLIAVGMNKPMRALRPESVVSAGRLYNGHSRHLGSAKGSPEGGGSPIASEIDLHDLDIPAFLRRRRLAMMREERND